VAVFDACFSGRTSDGGQPLVDGLQATPPNRRAPPPRAPTTVLAASDTFAGPLPGAGRPAFSYLLLGALRGWADEDGDRRVTVEEAHGFTRATIQALFKSDERLPRRTGPPAELARDAGEARPDLAALLVGRCPAHSRWTGRACKARPAVKCPEGTSWNGEACASECPTGTVWDGNGCAAQRVVCADGATWDGRACVGACPAGTRWRDGACVGDAPAPTTAAARPLTAEERAIVTSVAREWDTNLFKRRWVQKKSLQLLTTELQSLTSLVEATPTTNPDRIKYLLRVGAGWGEYAVAAERELRESRAANNAERAATSRKKLEAACRQGLKVLERAVAQDPQSFDGWKALGWAERLPVLLGVSEGTAAAEATGRAIAAWQNALRLRHSDAPVLLLLASAERDAGRPQQARSSLEKAAAIAPDEPDIAVLRALFALEDGQRARARKFLGLPWWRSPPPVAEPLEPLLR